AASSAKVLTPGAASAPTHVRSPTSCGSLVRTGSRRISASVPTHVVTAAPTSAADGAKVASSATSKGPPTKNTSCSDASSAKIVERSSGGAISGSSVRTDEPTGGIDAPASAATTPSVTVG